ncbi:MAG: DNA topoisomerase [Clostridia bacterium]|nr:DNA topoisomerase [Clostridia bacterium]
MSARKRYDNDSISSLKGADRVRLRPSVIFGSNDVVGCQHAVFEILSNSIDEAKEGYGSKINVTKHKDGSITVEDFGRGIPLDYNEREGRYNWELVFCELYAGGKYNNDSGENYEFSLGLNGLGACSTQYASEYMDVTVYRDMTKFSLHFERGENIGGLSKEPIKKNKTGTVITWKPDREVFTDVDVPSEYFTDVLRRQAVCNAGISFTFRDETKEEPSEETFCYERGITQYIDEMCEGNEPMCPTQYFECERMGRDRADKPDYKLKIQFAFTFLLSGSHIEHYHNSSWLEYGGSPDKAVRSAFVAEIDAYLKQNGKYNKSEQKIGFQDIEDSLICVTNTFSTNPSYENQTKKSINNKFIAEAMTAFIREKLMIFFIENKAEAEKITNQVLVNKRSRESAERARLDIKKKLSGNLDIQNRVQKFVDCRSKDVTQRELYIVEGDSALTSCKLGRDATFQAIIPVRGKILNCLKADLDKIFKNDIITDLIKVLGCGVEVKLKGKNAANEFDINNLRWSKIIICTDADVDGYQIRTLILSMLYRLTPTLIEEGRVFIAESPLFEIRVGEKSLFAYTEKDKNDIVKSLGNKKYKIMRSKGLGENTPDMMWETTMSPETRRLIKVMPEDREATFQMFDVLLGDNLAGRKDFIAENGYKYVDLADIS